MHCANNELKYTRKQSFIPAIEVVLINISHEFIITLLGAGGHVSPSATRFFSGMEDAWDNHY